MSDSSDDDDDDEEVQHLAEVQARLRERRSELTRTIRALRARRRTPAQIRRILERSRQLIYKATLIRMRIDRVRRVH